MVEVGSAKLEAASEPMEMPRSKSLAKLSSVQLSERKSSPLGAAGSMLSKDSVSDWLVKPRRASRLLRWGPGLEGGDGAIMVAAALKAGFVSFKGCG